MEQLTAFLHERGAELAKPDGDPRHQLRRCGEHGVYEWFIDPLWGGQGWNERELVEGYLHLSAACMTTTFIITQRSGACRRIQSSENQWLKETYLNDLATGALFATLGISHLTTSHQHLGKPVLRAEENSTGFRLNGFSPWVTGSPIADLFIIGAVMDDGKQVLVAVPADTLGIDVRPTTQLVALSSAWTGAVSFENVQIDRKYLIGGPDEKVMQSAVGAKPGGLQTSTLALGLASASNRYIAEQALMRQELVDASKGLHAEWVGLKGSLIELADGRQTCTHQDLRTRANSHVLRSTQAALAAAKGAGYVDGHPVGRWCQEALFFMVWSCPQTVLSANLCEFAGIE